MIKINPSILSKTVKAITPKTEKVEEAQIRGTIVFRNNEQFVQLDGAPDSALTPISDVAEGASDAGFVDGDRVLVLLKNHQAIVTKNLTVGLQAQAAKEAGSFVTTITDEGITAQRIIANDTFTNTLRANHIKADDIIAGMATIDTLGTNYAHITNGVIDNAKIGVADVNDLEANYAHITQGVIDNATIDQADVNNLGANYAHVTNGVIDNAKIGHADVNGLNANYAHITQGVIDNAKIGYADVNGLNANYAHVTNGVIDNAKIGHADVNGLNANYSHITNGVIDNAKIGYADVNGLSANYASISDLNAAKGRIDNLEANEVVVNDTLRATNANIEYLKSDWISTDRLVLTGNNKNNYPPVEITESEFNANKTAYWTKSGNTYTQCTASSVYDADEQYYVRQTVKSIIEAINTANSSDPQVVVSNDKLIAASMDVAELSAITADMGELTAGKIQKGNNFINLNTSPASMEFKNASTWASATQGLKFDTQGNLSIKGDINITSGNVYTKDEVDSIEIGGRNLVLGTGTSKTVTNASGTNKNIFLYNFSDSAFGDSRLIYIDSSGYVVVNTATISFDWETTDTTGTFHISCNQTPWRGLSPTITVSSSNQSGHIEYHHNKWTSSYTSIDTTGVCIRTDNMTGGKTITIKNLKVELGNKATDWTPAPEDAVDEEQYIYISKASGTTSILGTTTWVTEDENKQNTWSTKRPTYNSSYPVLFVAKQKKVVSGTVTCTTPIKDDTTTIIDGGHITTGTIDTNRLNADTIKSNIVQTTDLNASKITSGTLDAARIGAGSIAIGKLDESTRNSISDAAQTATSYITDIDAKNGIILKAINGATSGSDATKQNYIKLNANGLDVHKGGASVAQYGDSARVGKTSAGHVITASDGIELWGDPQYGNDHTFIYSSGIVIGVNSTYGAIEFGPGGYIDGHYNEIDENVTEKRMTIEANTVGEAGPTSTQAYIGIWANGREKSAGVTVDVDDNEDFDEHEVGTTSVRLIGDKVSINDDPIADFVIEQGTSGIWTYRKWSSGIAECWGMTAAKSHAMTEQSGYGYWVAEGYSLPSGLFTSISNVQANRSAGQGLVFISVYSATVSSIQCFVSCTTSSTQTFSIHFDVKGRWK